MVTKRATLLRDTSMYTACLFITETESVYSAVRTGPLNETDCFLPLKAYITNFLDSINESHKDIFFLPYNCQTKVSKKNNYSGIFTALSNDNFIVLKEQKEDAI